MEIVYGSIYGRTISDNWFKACGFRFFRADSRELPWQKNSQTHRFNFVLLLRQEFGVSEKLTTSPLHLTR